MNNLFFLILLLAANLSCTQSQTKTSPVAVPTVQKVLPGNPDSIKVIHVFVALCDNKYQGIVPVPARIGNGQDPANNLYWGCGYGVKTYFSAHQNWKQVSVKKYDAGNMILERVVFKYKTKEVYLIADAYDGKEIKTCTVNFLKSCSGNFRDSVFIGNKTIYCGGSSGILSYVGHDGLMDFSLQESYRAVDSNKREAMIFACISKKYFAAHIRSTGAFPVVWTTGLCSPEAYSLAAALESRINKDHIEKAALHAAEAYSKFQKSSFSAARRLMVFN